MPFAIKEHAINSEIQVLNTAYFVGKGIEKSEDREWIRK